jgi:integrase
VASPPTNALGCQRLREVLAEGCVRAKIPTVTPHTLRHAFGTRWPQAGGDICKLGEQSDAGKISTPLLVYMNGLGPF